jgi:hypothetical protein
MRPAQLLELLEKEMIMISKYEADGHIQDDHAVGDWAGREAPVRSERCFIDERSP